MKNSTAIIMAALAANPEMGTIVPKLFKYKKTPDRLIPNAEIQGKAEKKRQRRLARNLKSLQRIKENLS